MGSAPLLQVRDLSVAFSDGEDAEADRVVDSVGFVLHPGRVLALVGESGSGKSVTAMSILGLLPETASVTGSIRLQGAELIGSDRAALRRIRGGVIGTVFQEPMSAFDPVYTIGRQIAEAIHVHRPNVRGTALRARIEELLAAAGLVDVRRIAGSHPHELSGGQLQRAMIAMAISCDPVALIADEPTTALDVTVQAGILDLLRSLRDSRGTAVLLITHDMGVVADLADDVLVMRRGIVMERGAVGPLFDAPTSDYTRQLLAAVPTLVHIAPTAATDVEAAPVADAAPVTDVGPAVGVDPVTDVDPATDVEAAPVTDVDLVAHADPAVGVEPVTDAGPVADVDPATDAGPATNTGPTVDAGPAADVAVAAPVTLPAARAVTSDDPRPAAVVEHASVVFRRGSTVVRAVDDVTFDVAPGEVVGLVGESGSGKSTIGRALAGLVPVAGGRVEVGGVALAGTSRRRRRAVRSRIGYVFQDPASSLNPRNTIGRSIAEPLTLHTRATRVERARRVARLLEQVSLPADFAERYPHELSGGQRQRVAIARALALQPSLLIADEPTSALDVSVQASVLDLLQQLQRSLGFACLFISHDLAVVRRLADTVVVLRDGRVVESGPADRVLADPHDPFTRRLLAAAPVADPVAQARRREAWRTLEDAR